MGSRLGAVTSAARPRLRKTPWGAKLRPKTELGGRNMSRESLSSMFTFVYKCIFAPVWILGFSAGTIAILVSSGRREDRPVRAFIAATILGGVFVCWFCIRLKRVEPDGQTLFVSNYLREVAIRLRDIAKISENRWINLHPITVTFTMETAFGRRITFMPRTRWFGFLSSHPVVEKLRFASERASRQV